MKANKIGCRDIFNMRIIHAHAFQTQGSRSSGRLAYAPAILLCGCFLVHCDDQIPNEIDTTSVGLRPPRSQIVSILSVNSHHRRTNSLLVWKPQLSPSIGSHRLTTLNSRTSHIFKFHGPHQSLNNELHRLSLCIAPQTPLRRNEPCSFSNPTGQRY